MKNKFSKTDVINAQKLFTQKIGAIEYVEEIKIENDMDLGLLINGEYIPYKIADKILFGKVNKKWLECREEFQAIYDLDDIPVERVVDTYNKYQQVLDEVEVRLTIPNPNRIFGGKELRDMIVTQATESDNLIFLFNWLYKLTDIFGEYEESDKFYLEGNNDIIRIDIDWIINFIVEPVLDMIDYKVGEVIRTH